MLVELEIQEDDDGLSSYCGEVDADDLTAIVSGSYAKPFVRLTNAFWPAVRLAKEDFEDDIHYIARYGLGDKRNYVGDLYVKVSHIILMSPLKSVADWNGRKLGDYTEEKAKLEA